MARLSLGDRSAFAPLYEALRPRAARLVAMRLSAAYAPDVVQSAMMKVFARASEFDAGRPCVPWFYAIVANEIRSERRRSSRIELSDPTEDALVDGEDPESLLVCHELERALQSAIESLDGDAANAIRAVLGLGPALDLPTATFRKRVSRAYAKLRLLLGGQNAI